VTGAGGDRTGVIVIRVWLEAEGRQLRARLTSTTDARAEGETVAVAGSVAEACHYVEAWLRDFMRGQDG
jgi:hypothetical protein